MIHPSFDRVWRCRQKRHGQYCISAWSICSRLALLLREIRLGIPHLLIHARPMKTLLLALILAALSGAAPLSAQNPPPPAAPPTEKQPPQAPDVAAKKNGKDGQPDSGFLKQHESFVQIAKGGDVDLLFVG